MLEFRLPSLGADMDEGKLVEWQVSPGEAVVKGQIVAVVETTKAAIDVESWLEGTVHQLLVEPGTTVPVGAVLATLLEPGEVAPEPGAHVPESGVEAQLSPTTAPAVEEPAELSPAPGAPGPGVPGAEMPGPISPVAGPAPEVGAGGPIPGGVRSEERRRISPAARRRAGELGVDLAAVGATGPEGTVTLADVEQAAAARTSPPSPPPTTPTSPAAAPATEAVRPRTTAERQAEMRKAIAAAMARSKREIPHYYLAETVPMRRATTWLTAANAERPITERLLGAVLQLKAVAVALADFPEFNGHYLDGQFHPATSAHLGVAISLRTGGLIAPALHAVETLALPELMTAMVDLVRRARAGSLRSSEVTDATITVSSLGEQGVESVFPIIYPPQVAIVGFGTVAPRPWVEDGELTVMPTVTASLAADHRVSDGHRGGLFLAAVRDLLQHPEDL